MPESESSRIFVTCDSTTSADAPRYTVWTLTIGSSIRGYSRTASRVYEMSPMSRMTSDSTVARTGRLMQISGSRMAGSDSDLIVVPANAGTQRLHSDKTLGPRLRGDDKIASRFRRLRRRDPVGSRRRGDASLRVETWRAARRTLYGDDRTIAQPLLTGRHDDVADGHAVDDLRFAVAPLPDVHLGANRAVVDDLEQELVVALRHQRLLGHDQRVGDVLGDQSDAGEHSRTQGRILVLHLRADDHRAPGGVDQRVHREHLAFEHLVRIGVERDLERLAGPHLPQVHLGHAQIDLERIDRLEVHEVRALLDVIADRH